MRLGILKRPICVTHLVRKRSLIYLFFVSSFSLFQLFFQKKKKMSGYNNYQGEAASYLGGSGDNNQGKISPLFNYHKMHFVTPFI